MSDYTVKKISSLYSCDEEAQACIPLEDFMEEKIANTYRNYHVGQQDDHDDDEVSYAINDDGEKSPSPPSSKLRPEQSSGSVMPPPQPSLRRKQYHRAQNPGAVAVPGKYRNRNRRNYNNNNREGDNDIEQATSSVSTGHNTNDATTFNHGGRERGTVGGRNGSTNTISDDDNSRPRLPPRSNRSLMVVTAELVGGKEPTMSHIADVEAPSSSVASVDHHEKPVLVQAQPIIVNDVPDDENSTLKIKDLFQNRYIRILILLLCLFILALVIGVVIGFSTRQSSSGPAQQPLTDDQIDQLLDNIDGNTDANSGDS